MCLNKKIGTDRKIAPHKHLITIDGSSNLIKMRIAQCIDKE